MPPSSVSTVAADPALENSDRSTWTRDNPNTRFQDKQIVPLYTIQTTSLLLRFSSRKHIPTMLLPFRSHSLRFTYPTLIPTRPLVATRSYPHRPSKDVEAATDSKAEMEYRQYRLKDK
jgi:hypothetical protein